MRTSTFLLSALGAINSALAAPTYPSFNINAAMPGDLKQMTAYFNMLATKVQEGRSMSYAPVCDLSKAKQPTSESPDGNASHPDILRLTSSFSLNR